MRPTVHLLVRPVPVSSIPPAALRLPPKPNLSRIDKSASPTIERLLNNFAVRGAARQGVPSEQGRGDLPPNLRIVDYVPKRKEYEGVRAGHRDLLRRLRREA
ncbi:hypothetical protein JCM11641_006040 [Rhodosporidiobolus odoratus]